MARTHALVAGLFVALAIAMTWPLAHAIDRAVAYPGDPFINTWILDWDWYATLHRPFRIFQANIFFPSKYSLAYSENLYGIALLLFPLRAAGVAPLTAHNIAMIAGYAFSGFAAYLLGRTLTGSALAGIAAGVFYAFVPFRFTQLPHVQHVWGGWVPLLIVALLRYARLPSWGNAVLFGAVFLMNGLSNIHWLLFGALATALSLPIAIPEPRKWGRIAAATAVALVLLAPFLYPYAAAAKLYGMQRSWDEAMAMSATARDWLNPGTMNRLYRSLADESVNPECWLFPGALSIALSIGGLAAARRDRKGLAIALLWIALGIVGSFGLHAFFHRFLFAYVPGFRSIRVPARWANIAYVGMAMLIAYATAWVAQRRAAAAVLITALFVIELRAAPIRWYTSSPNVPEVYRWLATQRVRIIELPIDTDQNEYRYIRWAVEHHRKMANGVSGFAPPEFHRLSEMWHAPEIRDDFIVELRRIGINLIVLHGEYGGERERAWLRRELQRGRLSFVRRFNSGLGGDWVFALDEGRRTAPELEAFLRGDLTRSDGTIALLDYPHPGDRLAGPYLFSGWALSPWGIRKVDLLFESGQVRIPANLQEDRGLSRGMPWYPRTPRPRFVVLVDRRPPRVSRQTDLQVEITDGRGEKMLLEGLFIEWADR